MTETTRTDDEENSGATLVAYEDPEGPVRTFFGDALGPFVQINAVPLKKSATLNPNGENERIVKVQADNTLLFEEFIAYNNTGGALYAMIFDSATTPTNGDVPDITAIAMAAGETVSGEVEDRGVPFTKGICVVFSTTPLALTIAGATAGSITIFYR